MPAKLEYPNSIPVNKAASAWGIDPKYLYEFASRDVLTASEIKKFVMKATTIAYPGKAKPAIREYFTRFMVLSLTYPLIEDFEKAILQLLGRDYLRPDDETAYRKKCKETFNSMHNDWKLIQKYVSEYYRNSSDEYIAQIPRRVFIETVDEMPAGSKLLIDGRLKNTDLGLNLLICCQRMGEFIGVLPIGDRVSREIIESNPFMKSIDPIVGSLRMRRPMADVHTKLAVGE